MAAAVQYRWLQFNTTSLCHWITHHCLRCEISQSQTRNCIARISHGNFSLLLGLCNQLLAALRLPLPLHLPP